jgi:cytochrome P450
MACRGIRGGGQTSGDVVSEMIRWVTPVRHFMQQAQADTVLGGVSLRKGDWLLLSYLSAAGDDAVFTDPFRFDIARRNADEHLAFGVGVHLCLGAHLVRMVLEAFFRELLARPPCSAAAQLVLRRLARVSRAPTRAGLAVQRVVVGRVRVAVRIVRRTVEPIRIVGIRDHYQSAEPSMAEVVEPVAA